MLVFSPQQLQSFAERSFIQRMTSVLSEFADAATMPATEELEHAIAEQVRRAAQHGFTEERDCARWVLCAWCFGPDFDRKIASIATLLQRDDVGTAYKALAMEVILRAVFAALAGRSRNVL